MIRKVKPGVNKLPPATALLSSGLFFTGTIFFVSVVLLFIVIRETFYEKEADADHKVFNFLSNYVSRTNTCIMEFFTFLGSQYFLVPAWLLFFVYFFFMRKSKWDLIKAVTIAFSSLLLMFGLKYLFHRPRPLVPLLIEVPGLSFPSGHAFMSLTFFGFIIYIIYHEVVNKWLKWISIISLITIIFLVGFSRVYLRLHYASDVIAGFCFGLLTLMIFLWLMKRIEQSHGGK